MSNWREHFADVQGHLDGQGAGYGVFGGSGAEHAFTVEDSGLSAEGPVIDCTCQHCGNRVRWTPSWIETAIVSQKQAPRDDATGVSWVYSPQEMAFMYPTPCGSCGQRMKSFTMTPDEAGKYLNKGIQANLVDQTWLQGMLQKIRAASVRR